MFNKTQPSLSKQRLTELVQTCLLLTEQLSQATEQQTSPTLIPAHATIVGVGINLPPMKCVGGGGTFWQ